MLTFALVKRQLTVKVIGVSILKGKQHRRVHCDVNSTTWNHYRPMYYVPERGRGASESQEDINKGQLIEDINLILSTTQVIE